MIYCRFENTLRNLRDCYENFDEQDLSAYEEKARKNMIKLCVEIALDYGHEVGSSLVKDD
jgi:hypothetical protein